MRDPIEHGNAIFDDILKNYPSQISDFNQAKLLLENVINATQGWVIVDFLDYANWDRLTRIEVDNSNALFYLIEHEAGEHGQIETNPTKGHRDGLILKFKDMVTYHSELFSAICIRGYTLKKNLVRKILTKGSTEFSIPTFRHRNFAFTVERTFNKIKETFDVLNSPIYSVAILPKNTYLGSDESQELLFTLNFNNCLERLLKRKEQLMLADNDDEDTICEKANTGRRIFEFVLKIECCLIEHYAFLLGYDAKNQASFPNDYDKLSLGILSGLIKKNKPINRQQDLEKIISFCNELSHDSGHAIIKDEAIDLFDIMISYTSELVELIKSHKNIEKHYRNNSGTIDITSKLKTIKFSDIKLEP
jgi:hypothetical protein